MPLVPSMLKTMTTDPIAHRAMRDMVLDYMVPDHRPLYDSVVREIKWVGSDCAEGAYEALLDALEIEVDDEDRDEVFAFLPDSYTHNYSRVLKDINPETKDNKRFYVWAKKF